MVLEKTLESPLDCKEIQPGHPKGDQSWVLIGRTDAESETPRLWPPDVKSWLIGKDPDAGKDRRQEEKGMTEDEMVGWHHWLNGHGFGWTPGVGVGKEAWRAAIHGVAKSRTWLSDWTELNWTELNFTTRLWTESQSHYFVFIFVILLLQQCLGAGLTDSTASRIKHVISSPWEDQGRDRDNPDVCGNSFCWIL